MLYKRLLLVRKEGFGGKELVPRVCCRVWAGKPVILAVGTLPQPLLLKGPVLLAGGVTGRVQFCETPLVWFQSAWMESLGVVKLNDQLWGYVLSRAIWAWCKAIYVQSQKQEAALLSEAISEPTSCGCKPQTASGTWVCSCPLPAWWIPGALAWNAAWFFHTWSLWPHVNYLLHCFSSLQAFMAFLLLAISFSKATTCSCHALCLATCLPRGLPQRGKTQYLPSVTC